MRNSTSEYNHRARRSGRPACWWLAAILLVPGMVRAQEEFKLTSEDMVAIHADTAWEDTEPDIVHFSGQFEMRIRDWRINADRAALYGKLDDPERLELYGSPARVHLSHTVGDRTESVEAEASEIVYERDFDLIQLKGNARLGQGENELFSDSIEYDIRTDRFRTQGETGVRIKATGTNPGN